MSQQRLHSQVSEDAVADFHSRESNGGQQQRSAGQSAAERNRGSLGQTQGQRRNGKKTAPDARSVDSGYSDASFSSTDASVSEYRDNPSIGLSPNRVEGYESQSISQTSNSSSDTSQIITSVSRNVSNLIDNNVNLSSSSSSSSLPNPEVEGCSSVASRLDSIARESYTDEEVEEYTWAMPYELKEEYQDAMILYSDMDKDEVELFYSSLLKNVRLRDHKSPKVVKFEEFAVSIGSKIKTLEFGLERCTYAFIFLTENFIKDTWAEFSGETCLMEAIYNPEKRWCVVPVFTQPKRNCTFKVPSSINSLKGVQYWSGSSDKFYNDSVKKLLDEKLHIRKRSEAVLRKKRRHWLKEYKTKEFLEKIEDEREERQQEERLKAQVHHAQSMPNMMEHQQKVQLHQSYSIPAGPLVNNQTQSLYMYPQQMFADQYQQSMYQNNPSCCLPVTESGTPNNQTGQLALLRSHLSGSSLSMSCSGQENQQSSASWREPPSSLDSNVVADAPNSLRQQSINHSAYQGYAQQGMGLMGSHHAIPQQMSGHMPVHTHAGHDNWAMAGPQYTNRRLPDHVNMESMQAMAGPQNTPPNVGGNMSEQRYGSQGNQAMVGPQSMAGPQNVSGHGRGMQTVVGPSGMASNVAEMRSHQNMSPNMTGMGAGQGSVSGMESVMMQKMSTLSGHEPVRSMETNVYPQGVPHNMVGTLTDQEHARDTKTKIGPQTVTQNMTGKPMPQDGSRFNYAMPNAMPNAMSQMGPGSYRTDISGLTRGETGGEYDARHVIIHNHYYPPTSEQMRPLNIINPGVVQIGESNVVSGPTDGISSTAPPEQMEEHDDEDTESESTLVEESDRGMQSQAFRNILDMPDPHNPAPVSQDNLPSDDPTAFITPHQYNPGLHGTQLKYVEESVPSNVQSGHQRQQQQVFPCYPAPRASTPVALGEPAAAPFRSMINKSLNAMPRPVCVTGPMQQSVRGTAPGQTVEGSRPMLNITAQKPGRATVSNLASRMDQLQMEQTVKKFVDDPSVPIPSIGCAIQDVVFEQTTAKTVDDQHETREQGYEDVDDDDLFDQTLLKQHHMS
ncbi:uncharacterized protein LOC121386010 isoform X2 [Gigantopelta aegis]|uniref:uncharacterized protein LOC121386010 isoform X2 n=1 Tax=Gigantopelta aegis TaxID=1735272 RepID=UPI001B88B425|nr:uncharacterized protein LOC121386010 isoform X2 [Gigantopelta aegis]